jgi:RNA polymerase sigma-70 factor (ECF subfamily)
MSEADDEWFSALYRSKRAQITGYALRRAASREDAADVVAETFEIAWRRLDDVPASPDDLLWLFVTARHVLANAGRRTRKRNELIGRLADGLRGVNVATQPTDEASFVALTSLRSLPDDDRELLMLTAWDGLSSADAGRVLGCSPTAARIRLHRARNHLKTEMVWTGDSWKQSANTGQELKDAKAAPCLAPEEVVEQ